MNSGSALAIEKPAMAIDRPARNFLQRFLLDIPHSFLLIYVFLRKGGRNVFLFRFLQTVVNFRFDKRLVGIEFRLVARVGRRVAVANLLGRNRAGICAFSDDVVIETLFLCVGKSFAACRLCAIDQGLFVWVSETSHVMLVSLASL